MDSRTWNEKKQIEKELQRQAILFEDKVKNGKYIDSSIKFADFADKWMSEYAEKQLAPKTISRYKDLLKRINSGIGHIRIDKIQPHHLIDFYDNLEEDGIRADTKYAASINLKETLKKQNMTIQSLAEHAGIAVITARNACHSKNISKQSAMAICKALDIKLSNSFIANGKKNLSGKTVLEHHRLISKILNTAVEWQVIISNPAERVKSPRAEHKEAIYLDSTQANHLIELLDNEPVQYRVAVVVLIYSGLRRGELCGLEWKDIDFDNNIISVCRQSQYLPEKGIFTKGPKNKSSVRTIQLSSKVFKLLLAYRAWQKSERLRLGDQWNDTDRLFTKKDGKPIHPDSITNWFHDFIKKTDIPNIHIHSLRHTNATLLIAEGINVRLVSQMLGHAQTSTTMNIYAHAIQSEQAKAAEKLGDILDVKKEKNDNSL